VSGELAKLTTYFGERDRSDGELLADELFALYGRERIRLSAMLRGIEGFGQHHSAHTDLLLSLSEDLPVVSVAVDAAERIEQLLPQVLALKRRGLVTLERARPLGGPLPAGTGSLLPDDLREQAKLTLFIGRRQRAAGRPAFVTACELLHRHGVHGATVLLGVDGTRAGTRTRARMFTSNPDVPMLLVCVGPGEAIARAAAEFDEVLTQPVMTLERVQVLRRDGRRLGRLEAIAPVLDHDPAWAQKLTVHSSEDDRVDGHPLHRVLVRRLRSERLAGATTLRGVYGFHDELAPRGDRFWQARRHGPLMTIAVDTHERIAEIFGVVEQVTSERGLVTVETVPVRVLPGV
jgi:PII-like signaling protein